MPEEMPLAVERVGGDRRRVGQPREDLDPVAVMPVGVLAGRKSLPRSLRTRRTRVSRSAVRVVASADDRRPRRRTPGLSRSRPRSYSPIQNDVAGIRGEPAGEVVEEAPEVGVASRTESALKLSITIMPGRRSLMSASIRSRTPSSRARSGPCRDPRRTPAADRLRIEEVERLAVAEHLVERFGHRRQVERRAVRRSRSRRGTAGRGSSCRCRAARSAC